MMNKPFTRNELINILRGWHKFLTRTGRSHERNVQALTEAADVLEQGKWISVEDRLPDREVLAANFAKGTYGYKEYIVGYVEAVKCAEPDWYRGKYYADNDYEILDNVTHWMPLPKPPTEEE